MRRLQLYNFSRRFRKLFYLKTMKNFRPFCIIATALFCFCGTNHPIQSDAPINICKQDENYQALTNAQRFGFFSEEIYTDYKACFDSFTNRYGVTPGYIMRYQQIDDAFPVNFVNYYSAHSVGTVISLNIKSLSAGHDRNDTLLREIPKGLWDNSLRDFADQAKQTNVKIYLRFGYEMNGDWFEWGSKPKDFIAAWKYAYRIFKEEKADNVLWVFSLNVLWDGATVNNDLLNYYPGDSVVDIVGFDGYNYGDIEKDGCRLYWKSFSEIFGTSLKAVDNINKPIWITEIGCATDNRRPDWIKDMLNFMESNTCVDALLWFDAHKTNEPDFKLNSDSTTFKLVKEWLSR